MLAMKEIREIPANRISVQGVSETSDRVIVEEPLEIYVNDRFYTLTMRLVGEEMPLAVGLCFTDGMIRSADDLTMIRYCKENTGNRIDLYLNEHSTGELPMVRRGTHASYSSCGICGSELITDVGAALKNIEEKGHFTAMLIFQCKETVETMQSVFKETRGTHAAGIFDNEGNLIAFSEDVGRHNALDKAIGKVLLSKKTDKASIVVLTSRISYEMVLKAGRLGVEVVAGFSAATSLAVELASRINLTLIGFLRDGSGTIYSAPVRVTHPQ
ncbi:MAG: formate dehydrogenase accessory protein [Syntrophorhabdus sp. PtaU1.Bin153]|nr:MAG: formate dehydrogenase accessory protein [Syntrophorhabdus sp. PtaU1.Bin153]